MYPPCGGALWRARKESQVNLATNAFSQVHFCRILSVKCHQSYAAIYLYFLSFLFIAELPVNITPRIPGPWPDGKSAGTHTHTHTHTHITINTKAQHFHMNANSPQLKFIVRRQNHTHTQTHSEILKQGHNFQEHCMEVWNVASNFGFPELLFFFWHFIL